MNNESTTPKPTQEVVRAMIREECDALREMLLAKNEAYGNSALDPVRVFSKASTLEQINVRLDDKLSRLARGQNAGEDPEWDIMGYLVLKRVHQRLSAEQAERTMEKLFPPEPEPPKNGNVFCLGREVYVLGAGSLRIEGVLSKPLAPGKWYVSYKRGGGGMHMESELHLSEDSK